jgi:PKHD-type hydroxylase
MINDAPKLSIMSNFWRWEEGISHELCDLLLKERATLEETAAVVGGNGDDGVINKVMRDSSVCWAPTNHWIEGILYNHGIYACESTGWGFNLGRPEQVQLTSYDVNSFYGWHEDWSPFAATNIVRKISVIALLSDPSEFEGGEFQFKEDEAVDMKRGTIIAFPSFVRHQVTPVTSGKRYSAVCWINGPRTF